MPGSARESAIVKMIPLLVCVLTLLGTASAYAQSNNGARVMYLHLGNGAGGLGFLYQGEKEWAVGLDVSMEGERDDYYLCTEVMIV